MHRVARFLFLLSLLVVVNRLGAQSIFTIAGGGSDDGRPATLASIGSRGGVALDPAGNLYISDYESSRVRRIDGATGIITTIAGNGALGFSGDGGPATEASLNAPGDLAYSSNGLLYILDEESNIVRRVDTSTGIITTVAGNGTQGFTGDGGPAIYAALRWPRGIAVDPAQNFYLADRLNSRVRRVDGTTGIITTVAGTGERGSGGDGGPATSALLNTPSGVAIDSRGALYIVDDGSHLVRRIDPATGFISTVAGNGIAGFSGDGGPAVEAALNRPWKIVVDDAGDLLINDRGNHRIRRVDVTTGIITTIAGNGDYGFNGDHHPATETSFRSPEDVSIAPNGDLFILDGGHARVRRVDATTHIVSTVVGNGRLVFTGDGGLATQAAFGRSTKVQIGPDGLLYVLDDVHDRVRRVDLETGIITTVAGGGLGEDAGPATEAKLSLDPGSGIDFDSDGSLYVADSGTFRVRRVDATTGIIATVAGNGTPGFSGDGGPATEATLGWFVPGVTIGPENALYIADRGNHRLRRVDPVSGIIMTIAGNGEFGTDGDGGPAIQAALGMPSSVEFDSDGNLYFVESNRMRRIDAETQIITTVAGGGGCLGHGPVRGDGCPALQTSFSANDIEFDPEGNLYFAHGVGGIRGESAIRRIDRETQIVSTFVGSGISGFAGDGGAAAEAMLAIPWGIAFDDEGNLFIGDSSNARIRVVYACVEVDSPELLSPSNGSSGIPATSRLEWKSVPGAFRYDLLLDSVSPPKRRVAKDLETTSFSAANLAPLTTYYWQVVARGDPFCNPLRSDASVVRSFMTTAACNVPEATPTAE